MNLGENIYKFRTQKHMSQGDLADALDVSRQSVSKWENNSAVPELDKLVKMAELFGITLDALVRREPSSQTTARPPLEPANPKIIYIEKPAFPTVSKHQRIGIFLMLCAFLYGLILYNGRFDIVETLFMVFPVAACGILYFMTAHPLFYSCWVSAGAYWGHFFILFARWEHHPFLIMLGVLLVAAMVICTVRIHLSGVLRIPVWLWLIGSFILVGLLILLIINCMPLAGTSVVEQAATRIE